MSTSKALASGGSEITQLDLTATRLGIISIIIFVFAYVLVTLTAGVGGSLLSVDSAAGVALIGQARGM